MIGWLQGRLLERTVRPERGEVIIDVQGVGYRVWLALGSVARLGEIGSMVTAFVHTNVREDAIELFGFPTRDERVCFEILIGAHGVGPSLALKILSVLSPTQLRRAVATDDLAALMAVKGVGRKTAAQVLLDLKSKLDVGANADLGAVIDAYREGSSVPGGGAQADVKVALSELGFGAEEIKRVVKELPDEGDAAALLRIALTNLSRS